jgi:threonylcarbamoyladenosine tRNA methylthiotransferase MtaB
MLRILSSKKLRLFYEKNIGIERTVLFESENKEGYLHGFTENYVKVRVPFDENLCNTLQKVKLKKIDLDGVFTAEVESLAPAM